MKRWMKILLILSLALCITSGSLFVAGKLITSRLETVDDPRAVPVLQMHRTLDKSQTIESARELSSRLADTRFVAFEGSDHFIHIEAPDQWADEVSTFVENLQP